MSLLLAADCVCPSFTAQVSVDNDPPHQRGQCGTCPFTKAVSKTNAAVCPNVSRQRVRMTLVRRSAHQFKAKPAPKHTGSARPFMLFITHDIDCSWVVAHRLHAPVLFLLKKPLRGNVPCSLCSVLRHAVYLLRYLMCCPRFSVLLVHPSQVLANIGIPTLSPVYYTQPLGIHTRLAC